jgi:anti-sigma factor RsiW
MSDPIDNRLRETAWRRKLTPPEQAELRAWLAAHPEQRSDWDLETALTDRLERLPAAPVASNFTARVLQAVERKAARPPRSIWSWRFLLPRAAIAGLMVTLGVFTYSKRQNALWASIGKDLVVASDVASTLPPEVVRDFDVIRNLDRSLAPDEELIALFQ